MKKKLILFFSSLVLVLCLIPAIKASAAFSYYETKETNVVIHTDCYGDADEVVTIASKGYVLKVKETIINKWDNTWYRIASGTYNGKSLTNMYVWDGNLKSHTHNCKSNGGACNSTGCDYTFPLSTTSFSATFMATNSSGTKIWSLPYSTGKSTIVRTVSYGTILSVTAKATNADDHVWYKLSDGNWVYPDNVTQCYKITYNANSGSPTPGPQYKLKGTNLTLSSTKPSRVGYIFKCWNTKSDGSGTSYNAGATYSSNAGATLYAVWTKCTSHNYKDGICTKCGYEYPLTITSMSAYFKVTNADGAIIRTRPYEGASSVRTASKGTILSINGSTVNQPGNTWYRLTDGNWVYSGNVTRCWKINYVNGGIDPGNPTYYVLGMSTSLKDPTKTGYTFAGWYLDSAFTEPLKSASVTTLLKYAGGNTVSVYAKWTANTYTIAFNGNGATSGSMSSKTATYDVALTLPSNSFKKTGYSFNGWNTKANGSGASYANGASVKNLSATKGATVTLYAQWKMVKPSITTQPSAVSVVVGKTATFKVAASGLSLSYQWQYSADSGSTWTNSSATGCNTATLTVSTTAAQNGYLFRCVVKNSGGSVTSSSAKLTVITAPTITSSPASVSSVPGKTVTFTVKASGIGLSYQWQWSKDSGSTWTNSTTTGYNTATLSVEASTGRNGYRYRCVVKNSAGSATSSSATLTIITAPKITTQPSSVTAVSGKTVTFKVKASGGALSYQWQWSKDSGSTWTNSTMTGAKTATLSVDAVAGRNGYRYRCIVKNAAGSVTSSSAKLTVVTLPTITTQPASVSVSAGSSVRFTVKASGTGLSYQWQYSKDNGSTWTDSTMTGSKTASLTVSATTVRNGYLYRCVVTNAAGSVKSSVAKLTVF